MFLKSSHFISVTKFSPCRQFSVQSPNGLLIWQFLFFLPLNMFLVPIKLRPSKFSPYLILIVFLSPYEKFLQSILVFAQSNLFNLCLKL